MEGTINLQNREFHPVANIFPMMGAEEFALLKVDIQENGLLEPIWIDKDGLIIDGRNRYLACKELDIEPEYRNYTGDGSLVDFVVSLNLKRRHLTSTQKAFVAINIEEQLAVEAKNRMLAAGILGNRTRHIDDPPVIEKIQEPDVYEPEVTTITPTTITLPLSVERTASQQAAKIVGTNQHYVVDAKKVEATAPEVAEVARAGKLVMADALKIAKMPKPQRQEVLDKVEVGLKPTDAIREIMRQTIRTELDAVETIAVKSIEGIYDVIIIDPPWPMQKIERDVTPNQVLLDYPTMSLDEITEMNIPCADNCHVWMWTTQKFLLHAFNIINYWGLKYVCTFVWHKPGGFQPVNLPQYNCEFALYCRKGSPQFLDTKDFPTCFNAPRTGHSEKPQVFYDMVRRVTAGRRLDMFNRRKIEGFGRWGKESA